MSKDSEINKLEEILISLKQLREDIEKKVIDELKNITDPIKMLEENMRLILEKIKDQNDGITPYQKKTINSVSIKINDDKLAIAETMKKSGELIDLRQAENFKIIRDTSRSISNELNKVLAKMPKYCDCPITYENIIESIKGGCEVRKKCLRIARCANEGCRCAIYSAALDFWMSEIPKRCLLNFGIQPDTLNKLKRWSKNDVCAICGLGADNDRMAPKELPCRCMVCKNCLITYNIKIVNEMVIRGKMEDIREVSFRCPLCDVKIPKPVLWQAINDPTKFINLMRCFAMLAFRERSEFCCSSCMENIKNPESKISRGSKHCIICTKCDLYFL